jgi:demethylmenaquinone methyltransferase/2-methoxy-6-polyprenyl-1,4-benzoquinol methylase
VLRPGGRLACLEITHPPRLVAPLFRPYFERIVPLMGRLIAGDAAAYTYLPASVRPFPDPERLAAMIVAAGFQEVHHRRLSIGVVCLHTGVKPHSGYGFGGASGSTGLSKSSASAE